MRRTIILFLALCCPELIEAANCQTNSVCLHDAASKFSFGSGFLTKTADGTQGTSVQTAVTNTIAGPVPSGYWSNGTASVIITKTGGGTKTVWLSAPLSAGVTISSTITCHLWGLESSTSANSGYACEVLRWTPTGGVVSSVCKTGASAEWTASAAVNATPPSCTATSTTFNTGDRFLFVIYNIDAGGTETASSRTMTIDYDAATGVNGDSYITFSQTVSFSSDSNNYTPPRGVSR